MGHRIAVMREGRIQQLGAPLEVYDRPATVFVAQFIGTPPMNLLPATVSGSAIRTASLSLPLPARFAGRVKDGQRVIAGIRPEHVSHAANGSGIRVTVDVVEPIGHESIVYASSGSEQIVAIFDPGATPRAGDAIDVAIDVDSMHLFDAGSERSLVPAER